MQEDEWPPAPVVLAAVGATVGLLPGALLALAAAAWLAL